MNEKFTSITPKVPEGNKAGTPLQEHLRNNPPVPKEMSKNSEGDRVGTPLQRHLSENPPVPKPEIAAEELANEVRDRIQKMQE
ncbi:hypothetical protein HOD19_01475 [bacterium]|jgi:hypothetical protein|nr:hypothetical protein [bacterium]MBT4649036.1 hypothetical protein [bacterium]